MDLPRQFVIREGDLRILNPFDAGKLATLGRALKLAPGTSILDLCSGKGELLCTWARDHGVVGTGVDISTAFTAAARQRAAELGVAEQVSFVHGDAAAYDCEEPVDVAACVGATWIGDGVPGTLEILARRLRPGGMALVGEPYWRIEPPDQATVEGCHAHHRDDFHDLPGLVGLFGEQGWDLVEMVLADQDSWDRYAAAHWLNLRRWLDDNPDDPLAPELRQELTEDPLRHVRYRRDYLGWGVFALIRR
ncbi:class I SAM-dependent methyltransferase [Micromonospora fiedleri]|uniref:Class I SAM-dependent methyltransferase n=1 Tax=Micromonospora fiedleri TaxID=1157498 RepID=A0ABS1UNI4_9ACTN|nr:MULTISPECIES: methyltransferase domain-containing protein [Micromonospora]MBL6277892.1 class I SAM-dependent methyltransferase [Micromonospora fiedleri]WSK41009.1 methyltransferase domain-containing protein [Micromonospora maris]